MCRDRATVLGGQGDVGELPVLPEPAEGPGAPRRELRPGQGEQLTAHAGRLRKCSLEGVRVWLEDLKEI